MNLPWNDVLALGPQLFWLLPGPLLLLWFFRRGWLGPRAFQQAPDRPLGLMPLDLAVGFSLMILGSVAAVALIRVLFGPLGKDAPLHQLAPALVIGQLLGQGSAVAYLLIRARGRGVGLSLARPWRDLKAGAAGFVCAMLLVLMAMAATAALGTLLGDPPDALSHTLLSRVAQSEPSPAWAVVMLSAMLLAPVLEEILYRGLGQTALLNTLGPAWRWPILMLVSAGFAVVHLGAVTWHALPALFLLGMVFGWLYERTGSLWPPILAHAGFNTLNLLVVMFLFEAPLEGG